MPPVTKTGDDIGQPGSGFGQVGRIDLAEVAQADQLGTGTGPGDQRFQLLGRQVLRFVDNDKPVQKSAAAHKVHRANLDAIANQVLGSGPPPVAAFAAAGQYFQVVHQRTHPRLHFFFLGARQETDILAQRDRNPRHDDLAVEVLLQCLGKTGGQRQQGFAGTGGAEYRDEIHFRIHQQVEGVILLAVTRSDPPDVVVLVAVIGHRFDNCVAVFKTADGGVKSAFVFRIDKLIGIPVADLWSRDTIKSPSFLFPGVHFLAVFAPEIIGQRCRAGKQDIDVIEDLVIEIVFRVDTEDCRLDAQVDVFGHQRDMAIGLLDLQGQRVGEDGVVGNRPGQIVRQYIAHRPGLEKQPAGLRLGFAIVVSAGR